MGTIMKGSIAMGTTMKRDIAMGMAMKGSIAMGMAMKRAMGMDREHVGIAIKNIAMNKSMNMRGMESTSMKAIVMSMKATGIKNIAMNMGDMDRKAMRMPITMSIAMIMGKIAAAAAMAMITIIMQMKSLLAGARKLRTYLPGKR